MHRGVPWSGYNQVPLSFCLPADQPPVLVRYLHAALDALLLFSIWSPRGASNQPMVSMDTGLQTDTGRVVHNLEVNCRPEAGLVFGEL